MLGKTLESALERKEIKPVNTKGNQPCLFIGRTNAEVEAFYIYINVYSFHLMKGIPFSLLVRRKTALILIVISLSKVSNIAA